jgi:hypothetical protein
MPPPPENAANPAESQAPGPREAEAVNVFGWVNASQAEANGSQSSSVQKCNRICVGRILSRMSFLEREGKIEFYAEREF